MAEGFRFIYILPLGLVRLRTFRLSTWVRSKLECRCWGAHGEDVSFTDAKIKSQREDVTRDVNDVMHRKRARRILGIWEKWESWELDSEHEGSIFGACWGQTNLCAMGATRVVGGDGKASIERLCLSPYVEKPFNSKVIKSLVSELRSRKYFSCFGNPMFYVYMLWTFYVRFTYSCMGMLQY